MRNLITLSVLAAFLITLCPELAHAERENPLSGQPAVRHRLLLIKNRLEITPAFEATINSDYKHTVGVGLKTEYHLSDRFAVGGVGFFGIKRF